MAQVLKATSLGMRDESRVIVALSGKKGCGKSTVAKFLEWEHAFQRISYASPSREMLKALGLTDLDFSPHNKETPIEWLSGVRDVTPRYLMQTLMSAWGREQVHPDLWAMVVNHKIRNSAKNVVIDDQRFDNEAERLAEDFGKESVRILRIVRPGLVDNALSQHPSEKGVSKFLISASIVNDGDRDQLCSRVLGSLSQPVRENANGSLTALRMRHGKIACDGSAFRPIREKPRLGVSISVLLLDGGAPGWMRLTPSRFNRTD
jgi:hypothetical protein